jgi:hypothetical protein
MHFSQTYVTHFCHHSMESGFPLTAVQMLYSAVDSTHPAATTAIYPLLMQFVVSCSHFMDGALLRWCLLGHQSRVDPLAGRQKPLIL